MENKSNMTQPTEGWSIPIEVLGNVPRDYRVVDIMERPDGEGILLTFLEDTGIKLYELDWLGQIERDMTIEGDYSHVKVLDVGYDQVSYNVYISDRSILETYPVSMESLAIGEKNLVSESSEQFSVSENAVIVGNDQITEIFHGDELVASFEDYNDLKRVNIELSHGKILAIMDTVKGSSIITVDDQVKIKELISPAEENNLGYLQDVYFEDGVITVLSSKHHVGENFPSSFSMWQLDEDLEEINKGFWYHNRTSHRPIISHVDGDNIHYILAVLTRQDENRQAVMDQPRLQDGTFTNILHFTVNDSDLVDYDRLTTTREYPIGYEYIRSQEGDLIVWADRVGDNATIRLAGMGEKWMTHANKNYTVDYFQIGSEILMSFVASIIWGVFFAALDLLDYILPVIIFGLVILLFNRLTANLDRRKKDMYMFILVALCVSTFKFFISAIGNSNLQAYGHIYPDILGNDLVLGVISLVTSMCSLFLTNLWYNRNKDLNGYVHTIMYVGFEIYFYVFSIMVYVVAAMTKMNLMV